MILAMEQSPQAQQFYKAHLARDPRFDGRFFVAVKTTKIYCRPICPARKAQFINLEFFLHAAQAEEAGYRPCLRCRPETAPGSAAWLGTSAVIRRALRMMDALALEDMSVSQLAEKLGMGERWLRGLFQKELGVSPQTLMNQKRLDAARRLLDQSSLSITEIAMSSGFQSIRRFNDAFKKRFHKTPREIKKTGTAKGNHIIRLNYRPPFAWDKLLQFLKARTIPGVERVHGNTYERLVTLKDAHGWFRAQRVANNSLEIEFWFDRTINLAEFAARLKHMFDLDADPMAIAIALREDENMRSHLRSYRGLRIPGCWDGFELAVRAIVGQKISVKAAHTVLSRITKICGETQNLNHKLQLQNFFPAPQAILDADLSTVGLTKAKIECLKAISQSVVNNDLILDGTADYQATLENLSSRKGIGPWTVEYIAMRALRNPDAFPHSDLEIKKKIQQLQLNPQKWAPWRAYGAVLLWSLAGKEAL